MFLSSQQQVSPGLTQPLWIVSWMDTNYVGKYTDWKVRPRWAESSSENVTISVSHFCPRSNSMKVRTVTVCEPVDNLTMAETGTSIHPDASILHLSLGYTYYLLCGFCCSVSQPCHVYYCFRDSVLGDPEWPQIHYVVKKDFEFLTLPSPPLRC